MAALHLSHVCSYWSPHSPAPVPIQQTHPALSSTASLWLWAMTKTQFHTQSLLGNVIFHLYVLPGEGRNKAAEGHESYIQIKLPGDDAT